MNEDNNQNLKLDEQDEHKEYRENQDSEFKRVCEGPFKDWTEFIIYRCTRVL